jgi:hypothetical protein
MIRGALVHPAIKVCIDVRPDSAFDFVSIIAWDLFGNFVGEKGSAAGITETVCAAGSPIYSVRFPDGGGSSRIDNMAITFSNAQQPGVDFDGDGRSDVAVQQMGNVLIVFSFDNSFRFLNLGAIAVFAAPADYDGNGQTEVGNYNSATGVWTISRLQVIGLPPGSQTIVIRTVGFGGPGFFPVPADYDGDGKADVAVYSANGAWSIERSSDGGNTVVAHGGPNWESVPADYDGDGKTDIAVYNDGAWSILRSSDAGNTVSGWGGPNCEPVPADYDGDGRADIAVYCDGAWSIIRSSDGGNTVLAWGGAPEDIPVPADYDGDGKADIAVYRNGYWIIKKSSDTGTAVILLGGPVDPTLGPFPLN